MDIVGDTVHFRLWHVWYEAVADGRRTAEVRIVPEAEWDYLHEAQPRFIHFTDAQTDATLRRRITYMESVGELPEGRHLGGNHVVLICFQGEGT